MIISKAKSNLTKDGLIAPPPPKLAALQGKELALMKIVLHDCYLTDKVICGSATAN